MALATSDVMLIRNVMSPRVVTCIVGDNLQRVAQLMWDNDIGFLPVLDREGRVAGVVTDRDSLMAAYTRGTALHGILVETVMAHPPVTCTIHDDARQLEMVMAQRKIRRVPVIDQDGKAIGIVTLGDLARASLVGHDLSPRGPTSTLAVITQPRRRAGN